MLIKYKENSNFELTKIKIKAAGVDFTEKKYIYI